MKKDESGEDSRDAYPCVARGSVLYPTRTVLRFAAWFTLVIALLIAPWPRVDMGYAKALRVAGEWVFGKFGAKGIVVFRANDEAADTFYDTKIFLGNRDMLKPGGKLETVSVRFSTRYTGYLPAALVVALIAATPVKWRRRLWALGWGLLSVNCFVAFVLFIMILNQYSESGAIGLYQLTGLSKKLVRAANEIFVGYIGAYFAVPVFIWIAVTFRREDWTTLLADGAKETSSKNSHITKPPATNAA